MPKSTSKSSAPAEVIQDSEEETPQSSKKKDASKQENSNGEGEGSGEEEYEIESIIDAKHGLFPSGRTGYLVRWKGYTAADDSWVDQQDAEGAIQMIEEYWEKHRRIQKGKTKQTKARPRKSDPKATTTSPDADEPSASKKRKSTGGNKSKSSQPGDEQMEDDKEEIPKAKKSKRTTQDEKNEMDVDETEDQGGDYLPMDTSKYREKSWEKLVQRVDTIEKTEGVLKVFFTLNNGDKVVESSRECAKHFPQKLIQFYESNLRWRETEQ